MGSKGTAQAGLNRSENGVKSMRASRWGFLVLAAALSVAKAGSGFDADGLRYVSPLAADDNGIAGALALDAEGRLVAAGTASARNSIDAPQLIVRRFEADGSDASPTELLSLQHAGSLSVPSRGLLIDDAGRIFLAYNLADATSPEDARGRVVQVGSSGGLPAFSDFSFDPTLSADSIRAIAMDLRRRVVVAATTRASDGSGANLGVLLRLSATGAQEMSFAGDGSARIGPLVSTAFFQRSYPDILLNSVLLHADGRITVVGTALNPFSNDSELLIARFLENGTRDPDFNGGMPLLYAHRRNALVASITAGNAADMAPDGTLVVAARTFISGSDEACLWQFDPAGAFQGGPCEDFGSGDAATDVLLLPNGGVLGMARFSDGGTLRTTLAFWADGLPFSGDFIERFPTASRSHSPAGIAYDPDRRQLVGLASGVIQGSSGLFSQRWVLTRDTVNAQSDLDVSPDPIALDSEQSVAPSAVVRGPVTGLTGFDPELRLPLRVSGGSAVIDGIRFEAGAQPELYMISRDAFTPSLSIVLEHIASATEGESRRTDAAVGGMVRAVNLALTQGTPATVSLTSTVEPPGLPFRDGFEQTPD